MTSTDPLWQRLLAVLATLGVVDASRPGRLRVDVDGSVVEIVMTRRDRGA